MHDHYRLGAGLTRQQTPINFSTWNLSIPPNLFVSTFVTASRFLVLMAGCEGIAQLRRLDYQSAPRRLDYLDRFDAASRGPLGCFRVFFFFFGLFCIPGVQGWAPSIARWGTASMFVAMAMDPFAQADFEFRNQDGRGTE